ncbi:cell wall-binding repeat-containing protein [Clostridium sp. JS66]|uniref:cell wall-binding repeat-containing protein n=1 Tax=Clostridium sp. JS66 TaxID=3064705 RepID=UPI00298DD578|nr:cell wall-binding repeat-containing protein [Clostridium sp. JS66]WPC42795.1 cell wall-binding repeat-containing protein [Clostridium sp. JS66]
MKRRRIALIVALAIIFTTTGLLTTNYKTYADGVSTNTNITRITGTDYYNIGEKISQKGWTTSDNVILASSSDFPDALTGTVLGIKLNAPILFTDPNGVSPNILDELHRLQAKKVYILGGTGSVGQDVETTLKVEGFSIERLWGQDRFGTALAVGKKVEGLTGSKTAFLANAYNYPDALSSSTFAGKAGDPILLTDAGTLNEQSRQALKDWGITNVYVLGGTGVISTNIENELKGMGISITRLGGVDRYETSQQIVKHFDGSLDKFTIVTGQDFHNALVASVYAEKIDHPLILADNAYNQSVKSLINGKDLLIVGDYKLPDTNVVDEPGHTANHVKQQLYDLGFVDSHNNVILNPYGAEGNVKFTQLELTVGTGDRDMSLVIYQSNPEIDQKIKTIVNMILPTQGNTLYSILDTVGLTTRTVELDGRTIKIGVYDYGLVVDFGPVK